MTDTPETAVRYDLKDAVALLTIDFPPVNALGAVMRDGFMLRLEQALADEGAKAIVIVGANDRFIAGADIREFGKPKRGATLHSLQDVIQNSPKPVVAAIDGHALGGGFEVALTAHFRVAASRAKVGLPEVNLGLLPGAGGTQRTTRLVGPEIALDLILSGKHISAARAKELGLIDEVTDGDVTSAAVAFASRKAAEGGPYPVAVERTDKIANVDPKIFADIRLKNANKWKGMVAPFKIVECVEAATTMAPLDGLRFETEAFEACNAAPSRAAQVHLFFAERAAAKVDGVAAEAKPKTIKSVGVIGAGTMGGGITMSLVNAGLPVKLLEVSQEAMDAGLAKVKANYQTSVSRGSTTQQKVDAALKLISPVFDYGALADVDLVIEAVFENMPIKQEIFAKLDTVCKPGAVLASNTSALSIDEIATATKRPGDVIGLHFFSPANVMKLLEVVRGDLVSAETILTAMDFAKRIGKVPVLAGNQEGFIGNRILMVYGRETEKMLEEGATPWSIDKALKDYGFPMGIFLMRDMAGLDVSYRMRQNRIAAGTLDANSPDYTPLPDRICEKGRYGQKTGAGYYKYDGRNASPDPEIEAMLAEISREKGIARRTIDDEEIVWRVLGAMVNEGAKLIERGVAQRASDIDVTYAFGYGFPKYRGGPMFWAQQQGLDTVLAKIRQYHARYGSDWTPAPLLEKLVAEGSDWNGQPAQKAAA